MLMFVDIDEQFIQEIGELIHENLEDKDPEVVLAGIAFYAIKVIHENYEYRHHIEVAEFFSSLVVECVARAQRIAKQSN